MDWLEYENEAYTNGYKLVCGVDEAGRGPLAGPVVAAAVILPQGKIIEGVNDSKKLTAKKRAELFPKIKEQAVDFNIVFVDEKVIDEINILQATFLAMSNAIKGLKQNPEFALIDGDKLPALDIQAKAIIKGDSLSNSIAAASILAKVARDEYMLEQAKLYPEYEFDRHKGYGTKLHRELILKYGPCEIHRKSFLKKILGDSCNV